MDTNNMAFQIGATKAQLSGPAPVPTNVYTLQVAGFKPKIAKSGTSLNYNGEFTVTGAGELDGRKVFSPLNTSFMVAVRDFVHATGNEMEIVQIKNEETGEVEDVQCLPGFFEGQDQFPQDPEKWGAYRGPLTNATFRAEVVETSYQGKPKNEIRAFFCAVQDCAVKEPELKHSTNLIKS